MQAQRTVLAAALTAACPDQPARRPGAPCRAGPWIRTRCRCAPCPPRQRGEGSRQLPAPDILHHLVGAGAFGEVGTVQFPVAQVGKEAVAIAGVAAGEHHQAAARRQRRLVDLDDVRDRAQPAQAVVAVLIGGEVGAVLEVHAHAGDAQLAGVQHAVAVAVDVDLADHAGTGVEGAPGCDQHPCADHRGSGAHALRLRAVDAVTPVRAHPQAHLVVDVQHRTGGDVAEGEGQRRPRRALRIGTPGRSCRLEGDLHRAGNQLEAQRQRVVQLHVRHGVGAAVAQPQAVLHALADLRLRGARGLVEEQRTAEQRADGDGGGGVGAGLRRTAVAQAEREDVVAGGHLGRRCERAGLGVEGDAGRPGSRGGNTRIAAGPEGCRHAIHGAAGGDVRDRGGGDAGGSRALHRCRDGAAAGGDGIRSRLRSWPACCDRTGDR